MRTLVAIVLVVLALAAGWWLWAPRDGGPAGEPAAPDAHAAAPKAPALAAEAPGAGAPRVSEAAPEPSPAADSPAGSWRLVIDVRGVDADSRESIRVEAAATFGPEQGHVVARNVSAPGRVVLDVSSLFATKSRPPRIEVRVDAARFLPGQATVDVSPAAAADTPLEAIVTLVPAAGVVGRVVGPSGAAVAGAWATLHAAANGAPDEEAVEDARSTADGSFRVRTGGSGRCLLLVAAEGFTPSVTPVDVAVGRDTDMGELRLRPGSEVTGTVRWNGKPAPVVVVATRDMKGDVLRTLWGSVVVREGAASYASVRARTDAEGRYRASGLDAGPHRLSIEGTGRAFNLHQSVTGRLEREVEAPATGVDFDIPAARVTFRLETDGSPATGMLTLEAGGFEVISIDVPGELSSLIAPGEHVAADLAVEDHEPAKAEFDAPRSGEDREVTLKVRRKPPRNATVVVRLVGAEVPARCAFGVFAEAEARFPFLLRELESTNGVFRLEQMPAGAQRIVARPGTATWFGTEGMHVDAEFTVTVPETGGVSATVPVSLGGRLRIAAKDASGKMVGAPCLVKDAEGKDLHVWFAGPNMKSQGDLPAGRPNLTDPVLPPGVYTVETGGDTYAPTRTRWTIEPGKTTEVTLDLRPP